MEFLFGTRLISPHSNAILYVNSPLMVESLAFQSALEAALASGYCRLAIESHSLQLIQDISLRSSIFEIYGILADIDHHSTCFYVISFKGIFINDVENYFAKRRLALLDVSP
ncbi:hypothetical protein V5N11_001106 [Cardamine amara subsp. amara]|uniref:RNase H type-1 domain-containing protein n=1 Tax=Cardamine amara subsp. amara TaxID=228776 RepID=A0ABD1C5C0_CARAN